MGLKIKEIIFSIFKKGVKSISGHGFTKFYPVNAVYFSLLSFLRDSNSTVDVLSHKMFLDKIDSLGLSIWGIYEPFETELIKKEIKEGDIVLDLGANIGYYILILAKLVGKNGKVFAFEPDPDNFAILKKNIEINGYKNVTLIQKAVSNKTGKEKLYLSKYNKGAQTIYDKDDNSEFIEVESIRLNDYFKNNNRVDFIKMDIEGAEDLAIRGMPLILKDNKNIKILTEFNPTALQYFSIRPEDYLKILTENSFTFFHIDAEKKTWESITSMELMKMYSNGGYTNLLCRRRKRY